MLGFENSLTMKLSFENIAVLKNMPLRDYSKDPTGQQT